MDERITKRFAERLGADELHTETNSVPGEQLDNGLQATYVVAEVCPVVLFVVARHGGTVAPIATESLGDHDPLLESLELLIIRRNGNESDLPPVTL